MRFDMSSSILLFLAGSRPICCAAILGALSISSSPRSFSDVLARYCNGWRCTGAKDVEREVAGNSKFLAGSFLTSSLSGLLVLDGIPGGGLLLGSHGSDPWLHEGPGLGAAVVQAGRADGELCKP